jgi:hypothetical protein
MRRLTLQFALEDLARVRGEPTIRNIESMQALHILKQERDEVVMICRIAFKGPASDVEDLYRKTGEIQLLHQDGEGTGTYFIKVKPANPLYDDGVYQVEPYEFRNGKATVTFVGEARQVRRFLKKAKETGVPIRVVSHKDASFPPDSLLSHLTERQRKVIITAYNLGYFDLPKRISSRELAEKLGIHSSTLIKHRIKAERRLLDEILLEYLLKQ